MNAETVLKIDEKWSIEYEPANNDKPLHWLRYEEHCRDWDEPNRVTALFYAFLNTRPTVEAPARVVERLRDFRCANCGWEGALTDDAADTITAQAAEIASLRERVRELEEGGKRGLLAFDNVLAELEAHEGNVGEPLEPEDRAIVEGAKEDADALRAILARDLLAEGEEK